VIDGSSLDSAGTASPVPAESSVELDRIRRRFAEVSVADAQEGMRRARPLLADLSARLGRGPVPDLGPGAVPDQLTVLVYDAYRAGLGSGVRSRLTALRRGLP
jgi:hypothetical protein